MKRRTSALYALAAASGAALALSVPAMAQTYIPYTNTFEPTAAANPGIQAGETYTIKTSGSTPYVSPEQSTLLSEGSGSGQSYNYTSGTNYTFLTSIDPTLGSTVASGSVNGAGKFTNGSGGEPPTSNTYQGNVQARSGTQSLLSSWVNNPTGTTGFYRETTRITPSATTTNLLRPTVDLGGTVSFWAYLDTGVGTASNAYANPATTPITAGGYTMQVEIVVNSTANPALTGDPTALGKPGNTNAPAGGIYAIGSTNPGGVPGTAGANGTGSNGFPTGGHNLTNGSWQYLSFNIPSETQTQITGTAGTPLPTSGLGYLYDIDFTTGSVQPNQPNQVFNVYIDDLTIAPAPEPSAWLALAAGGAMLLGLGAMKARKRGMGAA